MGRLQTGTDEECRLFQKIAEQGHYAGRTKPSSSRQGTYAATADGRLLISWNTNDPQVVASKLRQAIARWKQIEKEGKGSVDAPLLDPASLEREERFYPQDGLVLRVFTRDLPREPPQEERHAMAWNQDFAWFTREEARQFLPPTIAVDRSHEVPRALVERLARLHLLDNLRGQTTYSSVEAVSNATLTSQIKSIEGDVIVLRLEGSTTTLEEGRWPIDGFRDADRPTAQRRGMELALLGRARYDQRKEKFVAFELLAAGIRHGGTQYNGRAHDLTSAPFGALLTLADDSPAERVPPEHFGAYGWK